MKIRLATSEDNANLLALEETLTQGTIVSVNFLKKDFLFHEHFFNNLYYIAEENDEIIASMAIGIKEYNYKGKDIRGGYIHSLRIKKEYQTKPVREFIVFLHDFFKMVKKKELNFVYGFIKSDNKKACSFAEKRKFIPLETFSINILPTLKAVKLENISENYKKTNLDITQYMVPKEIQFYKYKSVVFSFQDYSEYLSIKVHKVPKSLLFTAKMVFGKGALRKFEENNRTLSYAVLSIISAGTKNDIKELIGLKKNFCYENNINMLGIVNRSKIKIKFHIGTENTIYMLFRGDHFSKENFIMDIF
ncbi:hypothetical protein J7L48_00055 [bacterium]|nr:hypothetical protein [bacterium]